MRSPRLPCRVVGVSGPRHASRAVSGDATTRRSRLPPVGLRAPPAPDVTPRALRCAGRSRRRGTIGLVVAGVVATGATVGVVATSDVLSHPHANAGARGLAVALCVAVGAYTWWRRPDTALGALVAAIGLGFSLTSLMAFRGSLPFTLGRIALAVFVVFTVYVFVCFPRDRPGSSLERAFVGALVVANAVVWVLALALVRELPVGGPVAQCSGRCPPNALRVIGASSTVSDAVATAVSATTALAIAGVTVILVGKARSGNQLRRRAVEPLLSIMSATVLAYATYIALRQAGIGGTQVPGAIAIAAFLSMPIGVFVGQIRGRAFAATRLSRLVSTAGSTPVSAQRVESLICDALGDPTLTLALWSPGRDGYVDVRGGAIQLPAPAPDRAVTLVTRDGHPSAALIHDSGLDHGQGMTEGVTSTALMLLENTRLVQELRASRTRISEAAQAERVRLERDLHDGAQQRLVVIQIKLSVAREIDDPEERDVLLAELEEDVTAAVEQLRSLARGIYPPLLRERGLGDALRSAIVGAPGSIRMRCHGTARYRFATEAAVYYSILEATQNALKHAGPGVHVSLAVECADTGVSFTLADDGHGFDVGLESRGMGMVSMRDRMAAVGGALSVSSTAGGTTVTGSAPARLDDPEPEP